MVTLIVDGILPFVIISLMNISIIRTMRHEQLGTFNDGSASGSSGNTGTGEEDFKICSSNKIMIQWLSKI